MTDPQIHTAYLGLGTNMGRREEMLRMAVYNINVRVGNVEAQSDVIETEPWGFHSAHPFLNQVIRVSTMLTPHQLLGMTQQIERDMGRSHKSGTTADGRPAYHDRPIDIDILLYDRLHISQPDLVIPHPLMHLRPFVMQPLRQVISDEELAAMQLPETEQ